MSQEDQIDFDVSDVPDEETQKTIDELKAEGKFGDESEEESKDESEDKPKEEESKTEETKEETKEEDTQTTEESTEETEDKTEESEEESVETPKTNRTPKMVETYKLKIAEKQAAKREEELLEEIEKLKKQPSNQESASNTDDSLDEIKKLAEDKGVDEELLSKIVDLAGKRQLPESVTEAVKELEQIKKDRQVEKEDQEFEQEFQALDCIKAEFPEIKETELVKVKSRLKELAFSEDHSSTSLKFIFKGLDEFREASIPGKKTAETSSTGKRELQASKKDFASWTPEDIAKASREETAEYFEWTDKQA